VSDRRLDRLETIIAGLERELATGGYGACVLHELVDGTPDTERFTRTYGMTPDQAEAAGVQVIIRTNFKRKDIPLASSRPFTDQQSVGSANSIKALADHDATVMQS
jgi:hypothetical protein